VTNIYLEIFTLSLMINISLLFCFIY